MPLRLPILQAESKHLTELQIKIQEMELDNRDLHYDDFLIIEGPTRIKAFGRLKQYEGFQELCSLGVVKDLRHLGLGAKLVKELCTRAKGPLYLVSIIPDWFTSLGFVICDEYPIHIADKLAYCEESLCVPENYVVMRFEGVSNC